jgi:hypothetical protein
VVPGVVEGENAHVEFTSVENVVHSLLKLNQAFVEGNPTPKGKVCLHKHA